MSTSQAAFQLTYVATARKLEIRMRGTPMEKGGRSGIIGRAFVTTLIWNSIRTRVGGRERDQMEMDNGRLPAQMRGRQKAVASELQIDPTDRHRANLILGVDSSGTKARGPGCPWHLVQPKMIEY